MADDDEDLAEQFTWFRELRPLLTILLTAVAGGITTFCSVDRHAQRSAAQELALKREQFQAEELAKYLALPMKEAVTKRAMATYLQAAFYSRGELELHRWATRQIDQIDRDTQIRRTILADRASELKDAQARYELLRRERMDIESKLLAATLPAQELAALKGRLNVVTTSLTSASMELESKRAGFEEETRLATDLRNAALVEAQRKEAVGQCCEAIRIEAVGAAGAARQALNKATEACAQMNNTGATFPDASKELQRLLAESVPRKCLPADGGGKP